MQYKGVNQLVLTTTELTAFFVLVYMPQDFPIPHLNHEEHCVIAAHNAVMDTISTHIKLQK